MCIASVVQELPEAEGRWQAAKADLSRTAAVPALGWFDSAPSADVMKDRYTEHNSLWLVIKFEGLQPIQGFVKPMPLQDKAPRGFGLFAPKLGTPVRRRCSFLRALWSGTARHCKQCSASADDVINHCAVTRSSNADAERCSYAGCLESLAEVHENSIVHGSVGSGCFMANTLDDSRASRLVVKLDNFGYGQQITGASGLAGSLQRGMQLDCQALAITFCELTFGAHCNIPISHSHVVSVPRSGCMRIVRSISRWLPVYVLRVALLLVPCPHAPDACMAPLHLLDRMQ